MNNSKIHDIAVTLSDKNLAPTFVDGHLMAAAIQGTVVPFDPEKEPEKAWLWVTTQIGNHFFGEDSLEEKPQRPVTEPINESDERTTEHIAHTTQESQKADDKPQVNITLWMVHEFELQGAAIFDRYCCEDLRVLKNALMTICQKDDEVVIVSHLWNDILALAYWLSKRRHTTIELEREGLIKQARRCLKALQDYTMTNI